MEKAWQQLASKRNLTPTRAHGTIAVRWNLDVFLPTFLPKLACLRKWFFPNEYMFLFFGVTGFHVVHAGGCKPQSRLQNHMAKAHTVRYTWTLDLVLCTQSDGDVLGALLHGTLSKIQKIIDTGYIVLRTYYGRARVIIGGDSPWLHHSLGLSTYFGVGSVYSFATWCRELQKWCDTDVPGTTKAGKRMRRLYTRGATALDARGCTKEPLLHIDDRHHFVVMCVLHLLIGVVKYITKFLPVHATRPTPHQRNKAQVVLHKAKTNTALKGKIQPDGEEVRRLLTSWSVIAKVMKLPSQARVIVEQMSVLLTYMYRWEFDPGVLKCAGVVFTLDSQRCQKGVH